MDSEAWDRRYAAAPELVWTAEPNRFVVAETTDLTPGRALDLAAGEGRNAVWLAGRGWTVTAADFSPVAVARGRALATDRGVAVDWRIEDVTAWTPEPAGYDLVLVAYLHLLPEHLAGVLGRAGAAVRPGGRIVVVGHDRANLAGGTGGPRDPAILLTPESVVAALHGLRVERAETARRPVTGADGATVDALDTVVVARRADDRRPGAGGTA
ncbi:class I SAM-dependent methyltransferase [Micromonospora endolithica]|uniref:Class I SAM-dependent methyltransferase n=1 Tax=Micromonospora endolithica TaxID=230091 RepID=A0A3A9ZSG1_9ACTN|nr:class I SAM-dependent methyltransferase [Micromonospora endolithica]RKN51150.1 class I SAM-dependent methyltransferase [Micromonospora endolithica]TWJ22353.1 methyltransferase family protein [Micromonospora endolithica]